MENEMSVLLKETKTTNQPSEKQLIIFFKLLLWKEKLIMAAVFQVFLPFNASCVKHIKHPPEIFLQLQSSGQTHGEISAANYNQ